MQEDNVRAQPDKRKVQDRASDCLIPDRRYRNPPVVEALCEIYFADSAWDDTIPGAFYERVKDGFPKKQQREIQQAKIALGPGEARAGVKRLPPWMQFVSDEKHRMIQIARDLLVVNQLHPYPHFEEWEPDIYAALENYQELAQPVKIDRVGLRYINRVVLPGEHVQMEDYFTIYPNLPHRLGDTHGSFLVRVEVPQPEGHTVLVTFGTAPLPSDVDKPAQAFTLDLYDVLKMDQLLDKEALTNEINRGHDNIVLAFEDSIKDRLRDLFKLEEQR